MKQVKIVKTLIEKGDILVMGWKQPNGKSCEWICELANEVFEDEILDEVDVTFGVYTKYSEGALSNDTATTFEDGFCDAQQYFRLPTTTELMEFYKAKANYYQEKAKKVA